ncbi:HNH endonuclease [Actinokineospora pegani]|uniref:HNH endonuclease n=1 Tax=Actinokineospora pegani TaxID=2654637 RepID=UPI0012E9EA33|nr:HNH endonuclease signature motif containing protein [Actinokineospora pegani]
MTAAWSLLTLGENRDFQGNDGYEDVLESHYIWDDTVANHRKVKRGDLVVLRDKKQVLGAAIVEYVFVDKNRTKVRNRCPHCTDTSFKLRTTKTPKYWCSACKSGFDDPATEVIDITRYTAYYGQTWRALGGALDTAQLKPYISGADQHAIRLLDRDKVLDLLEMSSVRLTAPAKAITGKTLPAGTKKRLVEVRTGQPAFRQALLGKYGLVCAVTGACPEEALHAAHLRAFAKHKKHDPDEGVLLRADIHQLFDRGLLAVDPATRKIAVDPRLADYPGYWQFNGAAPAVDWRQLPDVTVFGDHFQETVMGRV